MANIEVHTDDTFVSKLSLEFSFSNLSVWFYADDGARAEATAVLWRAAAAMTPASANRPLGEVA